MGDSETRSKPSFLKSNLAHIIGITAIVFTLILGIPSLISWFRADRSLSYTSNSNNLFSSPTRSFSLLYNGKTIDKVNSINIRVFNTGEQSIKSEDIIESIQISLAPGCEVLDAIVSEVIPPSAFNSFRDNVSIAGNKAYFKPELMNAGDSVLINVTSSSCQNPDPTVNARIDGIKELRKASLNNSSEDEATSLEKLLTIAYLVYIIVFTAISVRSLGNLRKTEIDTINIYNTSDDNKMNIIQNMDSEIKRKSLISLRLSLAVVAVSVAYIIYLVVR